MIKNKYAKLALCAALCAALSPAVGTSASILNLGGSLGNIGQIIPSQPQQLANYKFILNDKAYITGVQKIAQTVPMNEDITILTKENGVAIQGINRYAFTSVENVKNVRFAKGSKVFYIDNHAFDSAKYLTSVDFSNSRVAYISTKAFANCPNLTKVTIPNSIRIMEENIFANSPNLTDIYIDAEKDSVYGAPWGATNAKIHWLRG